MSLQLHVIPASWQDHEEDLLAIRREVFIREQAVPEEVEIDGLDPDAIHLLAVNEIGEYIGCARILPTGQIGRMAVLKQHRGTGVGARLLEEAVKTGRSAGFARLYLHAQKHAEDFYRKGGFVPTGEELTEADINHVVMDLDTGVGAWRPQTFDTLETARDSLQTVIHHAQRSLTLLHPNLEQELFAHPPIVDAISALARRAPRVSVRILLLDLKLVTSRGHPLLNLARRLDEKIKMRVLTERPNSDTSSFVCVDDNAYWLMPNWETYEGVCDLSNPVTNQRLADVFTTAWEKSRDAADLRTLRI